MTRFLFKILLFLVISIPNFVNAFEAKVVIVIDDIGYRPTDANALKLPGQITYAILPHTPYGKTLAQQAYKHNKDVLLHIPMESTIGKKLGPGALTSDMGEIAIQEELQKAFAEIPFAVGINNHMGSKLTQLYSPMAWTMQFLKEKNVLFLDSMTTKLSKGEQVAKLFGVPTLHRHVFLDNQLSESYITKQFEQLIRIAQSNKTAVGIAHPHPESIEILTKLIPKLAELNIELVAVSSLVKTEQAPNRTVQSSD